MSAPDPTGDVSVVVTASMNVVAHGSRLPHTSATEARETDLPGASSDVVVKLDQAVSSTYGLIF